MARCLRREWLTRSPSDWRSPDQLARERRFGYGVESEDLRLAVYGRFRNGHRPTLSVLASDLAATTGEVSAGLRALADQRQLALGADGEITMAHPFTADTLGFSVMGQNALWWGGCAWDSFALPHLLPDQSPVLVATACPACDTPHAWHVGNVQPPPGEQVAHFLVPARHMWDDVVHTCGNQRIFCSEDCVLAWLGRTGRDRDRDWPNTYSIYYPNHPPLQPPQVYYRWPGGKSNYPSERR